MNCELTKKNLEEYLDGEVSSTIQTGIKEHLNSCANCQADYEELRQMLDILKFEPVAPPTSFGEAWRERIRNEAPISNVVDLSSKQIKASKWYQKVPTWAAAAVILVCVGTFLGLNQSIWQTKESKSPLMYTSIQSEDAYEDTYQLRIVMVGKQSKQVQKIIRDFSSSHEGGAAFTLRAQKEETSTFRGLTSDEVKTLEEKLIKAGAKVKISKE